MVDGGLGTVKRQSAFSSAREPEPAAAVQVEATIIDLLVGQTTASLALDVGNPAFAVKGTDNEGRLVGVNVHWTSSNPSVATVDVVTGVVTARAAGNATVTARSTSDPALTSAVTIVATAPSGGAPASMRIVPSGATVQVGAPQPFTATVHDAQGNVATLPAGVTIGDAVDDSNVATIGSATIGSARGLRRAVGAGNTFVRAFLLGTGAVSDRRRVPHAAPLPHGGRGLADEARQAPGPEA